MNPQVEIKDTFIRNMFTLGEMSMPASIVVIGDDAKMTGLSMIFIGEAVNDNFAGSDGA